MALPRLRSRMTLPAIFKPLPPACMEQNCSSPVYGAGGRRSKRATRDMIT